MGYGIMAYRAPIAKLEQAIGSKDNALRDKILELNADDLDGIDENFDADESSAEEILDDLIFGDVSYEEEGYKYWYLIEVLVRYYGRPLNNSEWYPTDISQITFDTWKLFELETDMDIPLPDDFPAVYFIKNEELDAAGEEMESAKIDPAQVSQFASWIASAKIAGEGIVLFLY